VAGAEVVVLPPRAAYETPHERADRAVRDEGDIAIDDAGKAALVVGGIELAPQAGRPARRPVGRANAGRRRRAATTGHVNDQTGVGPGAQARQ